MDLIPKPDQVVSAVGNLTYSLLYGGLADLRSMPRTLVDEGPRRELWHYRPATVRTTGDPVLLVMPLAAPSSCYDLRRGCSLVQHLVGEGRPTYLVDYGQVSLKDRSLDLTPWVTDVLPAAITETSTHAGGRPVHLVGWSLGGIFALLAAADSPDLPIASITVLGSPVDTTAVPLVAPARPLLDLAAGRGPLTSGAFRALEGAVSPLLGRVAGLSAVQRVAARPLALATHLDDAEHLAQLEAVERFSAGMTAYPGRTFGQLYHRFLKDNALVDGSIELGDRTVDLATVAAPVLVVAGATDTIAPVAAVRAVVPLLTGAEEVSFEIVPGGHLGQLTGREARETTWASLDDWLEQWASGEEPQDAASPSPARTTRASRAVDGGSAEAIGANPERRFGSDGSRDLAR